VRAGRLLDGSLTTQLLYVAAKLGVADVPADGPRTGPEVAEAVGADPDLLTRVLRGLALEDLLVFGGLGRLVDVGGGYGILLGAVLRAAPELHAVLVDQPGVEQARRPLEAEGVAGRCEPVAGDFFGSVPPGRRLPALPCPPRLVRRRRPPPAGHLPVGDGP
jgi:hypothetical protein